jgi:hypothetical protein
MNIGASKVVKLTGKLFVLTRFGHHCWSLGSVTRDDISISEQDNEGGSYEQKQRTVFILREKAVTKNEKRSKASFIRLAHASSTREA